MSILININHNQLNSLDLSPATQVIESLLQEDTATREKQLRFEIQYQREKDDPRELSEIPEVRLWFILLDTRYPWLPFFLDWKQGELARYAAMLVPHQFSRSEGIQYNPEALEIWVMQKVFVLLQWLKQQGIGDKSRAKYMAQMFGYDLDDSFFELCSQD